MDFTTEMSMNDIERQFDEFDELAGLEEFENDSLIMRDPEIRELQAKSRRTLELLDADAEDDYGFDEDW